MMRLTLCVTAFCASTLVVEPAAAQRIKPIVPVPSSSDASARVVRPAGSATASSLTFLDLIGPRKPAERRASYQSSLRLAKCALDRPEPAHRLLNSAMGSDEERKAIGELTRRHRNCLGRARRVEVGYLRGAFAEQLSGDTVVVPVERRVIESDRYHLYLASLPDVGDAAGSAFGEVIASARCHVALAPLEVRELLATDPGSSAEGDAIGAIFTSAPFCAGAERPRRVVTLTHRAILAEAFYHWIRSDLTPQRSALVAGKHANA